MNAPRSYKDYRPSGVEWLDRLPTHWKVRRLRNVAEMRVSTVDKHVREDEEHVRLCNYVDVYKNDRISTTMNFMRATASRNEIERYRLKKDDVLITKDSETWDDIGVPALVTNPAPDLISGYHLALFRPRAKHVIGGYLFRALESNPIARQFHVLAKGVTRYGLSHGDIRSVWLPLPPLSEQAAIVRFLDDIDRRTHCYIHARQKLIALLEEQKRVIIHQAVTGQIHVGTGQPYASYKSTGVEWLQNVPDHWEIVQLRRVTLDRCDGPFGSGLKSSHYSEDGIRVVRLQNIGHGEFMDADMVYVSPDHYALLGEHSVVAGDVLIAGLGDRSHPAGRACVAPEHLGPAMVKADCFRFRLEQSQIKPQFAAAQLTATADVASSFLSTGATRQRTNLGRTAARVIGVPTMDEQMSIMDYITVQTAAVRRVQMAAEREMGMLSEYQNRVAADVITGKLDVRSCADLLSNVDGKKHG